MNREAEQTEQGARCLIRQMEAMLRCSRAHHLFIYSRLCRRALITSSTCASTYVRILVALLRYYRIFLLPELWCTAGYWGYEKIKCRLADTSEGTLN